MGSYFGELDTNYVFGTFGNMSNVYCGGIGQYNSWQTSYLMNLPNMYTTSFLSNYGMNFNKNGFITLPFIFNSAPQTINFTNSQSYSLGSFNNISNIDTFCRLQPVNITPPETKIASGSLLTTPSLSLSSSKKITYKGSFDKMLECVLKSEGGYNANDCGEAGNYGIRQSTYDSYREKKGLPKQDVVLLTKEEAGDIYYQNYYVASGADKIDDGKLALYVFDTAVNMGVSKAKRILKNSDNDPDKFKELRLQEYESIAMNPSKTQYLNGWKSRVSKTETFADKEFCA